MQILIFTLLLFCKISEANKVKNQWLNGKILIINSLYFSAYCVHFNVKS